MDMSDDVLRERCLEMAFKCAGITGYADIKDILKNADKFFQYIKTAIKDDAA